jgi:hypothetical protein
LKEIIPQQENEMGGGIEEDTNKERKKREGE